MKYIKTYEVKFRSPGMKKGYVGPFLYDKFFSSIKTNLQEPKQIMETWNYEDEYSVDFYFEDLPSIYFDAFVEIRSFLVENYNVKMEDIEINYSDYFKSETKVLSITIRGYDNIDKLVSEAKIYKDAKKYNL